MIAPASTHQPISAPVFNCCSRVTAARSSPSVAAVRSIIWPPAIPAGPEARASSAISSTRTNGSSCVASSARRSKAKAWSESPARIAVDSSKARCQRRLAAPEVVIVHARQIVVDQRVNVDAFDRERGPHRARALDVEQVAGGDHEQRPNALAAADRGVAHRFVEPAARVLGNVEQGVEAAIDPRADFLERGPRGSFAAEGRGCLGARRRGRTGSARSSPAPRRAAPRIAGAAGRPRRRVRWRRRARPRRSRACARFPRAASVPLRRRVRRLPLAQPWREQWSRARARSSRSGTPGERVVAKRLVERNQWTSFDLRDRQQHPVEWVFRRRSGFDLAQRVEQPHIDKFDPCNCELRRYLLQARLQNQLAEAYFDGDLPQARGT